MTSGSHRFGRLGLAFVFLIQCGLNVPKNHYLLHLCGYVLSSTFGYCVWPNKALEEA